MVGSSTIFDLLAADPRRRVLFALCDAESVKIPDDVRPGERLQSVGPDADRSGSSTPAQPLAGDEFQRRFETRLRHSHLPKLADTAVVTWDRDEHTVTRGPEFETVEPVLDLLAENATLLPDGLR